MRSPFASVGKLLLASFFLLIAVNALLLFSQFRAYRAVVGVQERSSASSGALLSVAGLEAGLLRMEAGQRGFVLSGDQSALEEFDAGQAEVHASLEDLRGRYGADAARIGLADRIESQVARWRDSYLLFSIDLAKAGNKGGEKFFARGSGYFSAVRALMDELKAKEREAAAADLDGLGRANYRFYAFLAGGGALSAALALVLSLVLRRLIVAPVVSVSAAASLIAEGSLGDEASSGPAAGRDEIARLCEAQERMRAFLRNTVEGLRRAADRGKALGAALAAQAAEHNKSAGEADSSIEDARLQIAYLAAELDACGTAAAELQLFIEGAAEDASVQDLCVDASASAVLQLVAALETLERDSGEARTLADGLRRSASSGSEDMSELFLSVKAVSGSLDRASELVESIDAVAGQTRLLSMNAAIEAAHAGAEGRGFAVVAEELRSLSDSAAAAAAEVSSALAAAGQRLARAGDAGERASAALGRLVSGAQTMADAVAENAGSVDELARGTASIRSSLEELRARSRASAAASRDAAARSGLLRRSLDTMEALAVEGDQSLESGRLRVRGLSEGAASLDALGRDIARNGEALEAEISRFR